MKCHCRKFIMHNNTQRFLFWCSIFKATTWEYRLKKNKEILELTWKVTYLNLISGKIIWLRVSSCCRLSSCGKTSEIHPYTFQFTECFLLYIFKLRSMDERCTLYDYRYIFHMYMLIYSRREHIHLIHPYLIISTSFIRSSVWWLMLSLSLEHECLNYARIMRGFCIFTPCLTTF